MRKFTVAACMLAALGFAAPPAAAEAVSPQAAGYVAKFNVLGETYKIRLTEQQDIDNARRLLNGDPNAPKIPNGKLKWGVVDVNSPYQWSIDTNDIQFADFTMELCDGLPSMVDGPTWGGGRFCPWQAKIVSLTPIWF